MSSAVQRTTILYFVQVQYRVIKYKVFLREGRLLLAPGPWRDLQKRNSIGVLYSASLGGGTRRRGLELQATVARSKVREETGRLSPSQGVTAFRFSSMVTRQRS